MQNDRKENNCGSHGTLKRLQKGAQMKERLDVLLVQRGHAASREKAKAVIMAGCVYVNGQKEDKAGSMFDCAAEIEVRGNTLRYVSRGGLKLEKP